MDRININKILEKHIGTLYDYGVFKLTGKKKMPIGDKLAFLILPGIIAVSILLSGIRVNETYVNILITALSIFIGLLFGLLTMIFELAKKEKDYIEKNELKDKDGHKYVLIKELFINTSFAILLSIFTILALFITQLHPSAIIDLISNYCWFEYFKYAFVIFSNLIAIFLLIEFLVTLLMILKRFFLLYLNQFE